jgi:LacI family transcriptional regulator
VGVIGFANEAFGKLVSPQLSSIDQQSHLMGEEVARLFLRVLKEKEIFKKTNKIKNINEEIADIVFDPILLIRESSNRNGV